MHDRAFLELDTNITVVKEPEIPQKHENMPHRFGFECLLSLGVLGVLGVLDLGVLRGKCGGRAKCVVGKDVLG